MNVLNNRAEATQSERVGGFHLRGRLGQSGHSGVFVAESEPRAGAATIVALRQIPVLRVSDRRPLAAVLEQARAAAAFRHPNLVAIHEVGQTESMGYVVMDYVAGEDLDTILTHPAGRGMPLEITCALVSQIAGALRYQQETTGGAAAAESVGYEPALPPVHTRDVFVGYDGAVRVLPAGLVARGEAGDPQYAAPELLAGAGACEASTVFCLGIVLWECLAGRFLFAGRRGDTPGSAVLLRPIERPSAFRTDLPRDLDEVVLRALDRDPARRFPRLGDFLRALDQVAQPGIRPTREGVGLWMRALFGPERGALKARIARGKDVERALRRLRELELGGHGLGGGTPIGGVRLRPLWTKEGGGEGAAASPGTGDSALDRSATPSGGSPTTSLTTEGDFDSDGYSEPPTALKNAPEAGTRRVSRILGLVAGLAVLGLGAVGAGYWVLVGPATSAAPAAAAASRLGRLTITSDPPGALVVVDGVPSGLITPADLSQLRAGRRLRIDVQKPGFQAAGQDVTIDDQGAQAVSFPLLAAQGRLVLTGLPKRARLFVDDVEADAAAAAQAAGLGLAVGVRRIRVELGTQVLLTDEIDLGPGTTTLAIGKAGPR